MPKRATKPKAELPWVVGTLALVAEFFGRSLDTVKGEWRPNGMPGRSRQWDLREILAWRDERRETRASARAVDETTIDAERRRAIAAANREERRDAQEAGELVEVDGVRRLFVQHVNEARSILVQITDQTLGSLPQTVKGKTRRRIKKEVQQIVRDTCDTLADLLTHYKES